MPTLDVDRDRRTTRRRVLAGAVAAAAAAALVLGGVAVSGHWSGDGSGPVAGRAGQPGRASQPGQPVQQAKLAPVVAPSGAAPAPTAAGVVSMAGSQRVVMTIRITGLPTATSGHFYYAWLLDPTTNKMLPVGVIDAAGTSTFELEGDLVKRYTAVDISLQADDGDPVHSPVSVLRASYAA